MSSPTRTARGGYIDFELMAIKAQLAAKPIPKIVDERRVAIEERDGIKQVEAESVIELLKAAEEVKSAPKRK